MAAATPVAAVGPWAAASQSGVQAYASNDACTESADGTIACAGEFISVFSGTTKSTGAPTEKGQQVCYSSYTATFDADTGVGDSRGVAGCAIGGRTVDIDALDSVTLDATVIELLEFVCDATTCTETPAGTVSVSGSWIGVGSILRQASRQRLDDGSCLQLYADRGRVRSATFQGSITASEAAIRDGMFSLKSSCAL
jgi:hypothetical protein